MSGAGPSIAADEPRGGVTASNWIARPALAWLLLAQLLLIAPHLRRLPLWLALVWLLCALWRVQVFRGLWPLPGRSIKLLLIAGGLAGIRLSYGGWVGLEPTVALLITGFSFKLVEASSRRDAYLLLFLGYFVALTEFLFEQDMGTALYLLLPVLLLTCALVALQEQEALRVSARPLRKAMALTVQALPLMLLLFLVFPRLAPLWQVPLPGAGPARTGLSEQMEPGSIGQLAQSDALAFRAQFHGAVPPRATLYWRALVLDSFDGRVWRAGPGSQRPMARQPAPGGAALEYEIYMEPTQRRWLYALERPVAIDARTELTEDYRLQARSPVFDRFFYRARVHPQAPLTDALSDQRQRFYRALPAQGNARARTLAQQLRAQTTSTRAFVERVLREFREQPFVYTLRPPPLAEQDIDAFLFETRSGFCEHYAGAFTFLMRAAGVPARVVTGYQGGEINSQNGSVAVRQFDAHAWVEVWLEDSGWQRVDPTAAVAPERIERDLESALAPGEFLAQAPFSAQRYRRFDWLNSLRLRLDELNYAWTRWVLNYRDDTQSDVLQRLLGEINPARVGALLVGGGALALGVLALLLLRRGAAPKPTPELRLYQRFCARLARRGYPRPPGMPPRAYARWLLAQQPQWQAINDITDCFEALSYRPLQARQRQLLLARMRRLLRDL